MRHDKSNLLPCFCAVSGLLDVECAVWMWTASVVESCGAGGGWARCSGAHSATQQVIAPPSRTHHNQYNTLTLHSFKC